MLGPNAHADPYPHGASDGLALIAVAFALGAAISWAASAVFARLGLRYMPATLGTFVSLISGVVLMVCVVALFQREQLSDLTWAAIGIFAAVGLFNFVLGRYLNFLSIGHLGVARATPITASTPLFAAMLAVLLLGETLNALTVLGTGLVLAGIYVVLRQP
jgi:drug/metabolite transporter (DMT)-like permease